MSWHRTFIKACWAVTIPTIMSFAWLYYMAIEIDPGDSQQQ